MLYPKLENGKGNMQRSTVICIVEQGLNRKIGLKRHCVYDFALLEGFFITDVSSMQFLSLQQVLQQNLIVAFINIGRHEINGVVCSANG